MTTTQPSRPAEGAGRSDTLGRAAAAAGALAFTAPGAWAMLAPRSFFEQLAEFPPYNQHLIQDIGAFQLGLGAVLALVALRPAIDALTAALLGTGIGAAGHAISHLIGHDLGGRPVSDIPLFSVIAVLLLAVGARRARAGDERSV